MSTTADNMACEAILDGCTRKFDQTHRIERSELEKLIRAGLVRLPLPAESESDPEPCAISSRGRRMKR